MRDIRKVGVLGAGTMGARIAAHFANAGVPSVLLDIVPSELTKEEQAKGLTRNHPRVRNRLAEAGLAAAVKSRPAAFFVPERARLITPGNFEDHLAWLRDCDWVIEAIVEDREAKRELFRQVLALRSPGTVLSSNTSGISIGSLTEGWSEEARQHFLGTHFFNPPRYLKLLEIVPTSETLPEVVDKVSSFGEIVLGKGAVVAKDTPNFIANRIGLFSTLKTICVMQNEGYTVEEVDALTGPAIGFPKSATLRTLDIVGLDILAHVVKNLAESLPNDEQHGLFQLPELLRTMLQRRMLGEKTGQGFYKKVGSGADAILTLDLATLDYRARQKPQFPSIDMARNIEDTHERVRTLFHAADRAGKFYQQVLPEIFHYTAMRVPEIADDIRAIDDAMRWGFGWECGPFELWDAVGMESVLGDWKKASRSLPPLVEKLLSYGQKTFYAQRDGRTARFDFSTGACRDMEQRPGVLVLSSLKARGKEVKRNPGASLIDLGDGVVCLEFHSKMNTIGADTLQMVHAGLKVLNENFDAMVIGNQGANFCVGANLMLLLMTIQEGEWDEVHNAVRAFQNANLALKYAPKPVVAAPFGMTLGGGTELILHATRVRAAAETYLGLVEVGVGLIPAGGGSKEMLLRAMDAVPADPEADPFTFVKEVFLNIGMAKASTSAEEARQLHYLSARDSISMNGDRLIGDAKQVALDLVRLGYRAGMPRQDIRVLGAAAFAKMKMGLHLMRRGEFISDYDVVVGTKLAQVLSGGGQFTSPQLVSEQYLLDLEREAFVSLCGEPKTVERIQYMLKNGKPLRN